MPATNDLISEKEAIRAALRRSFRSWLRWAAIDSRPEPKIRDEVLWYIHGLINTSIKSGDTDAFIEWTESAREQLFFTRLQKPYKSSYLTTHFLRMYELQLGIDIEAYGIAFYLSYFRHLVAFTTGVLNDEDLDSDTKVTLLSQQTEVMNRFLRRIKRPSAKGMYKYAAYAQASREAAVLFAIKSKSIGIGDDHLIATLSNRLYPWHFTPDEFYKDDVQNSFNWFHWKASHLELQSIFPVSPISDLAEWAAIRDLAFPGNGWLRWLTTSQLEQLSEERFLTLARKSLPNSYAKGIDLWNERYKRALRFNQTQTMNSDATALDRSRMNDVLIALRDAASASECVRFLNSFNLSARRLPHCRHVLFSMRLTKRDFIEGSNFDPHLPSLASISKAAIDEMFFATLLGTIHASGTLKSLRDVKAELSSPGWKGCLIVNGRPPNLGKPDLLNALDVNCSDIEWFEVNIGWIDERIFAVTSESLSMRMKLPGSQKNRFYEELVVLKNRAWVSCQIGPEYLVFEFSVIALPHIRAPGSFSLEFPTAARQDK